MMISKNFSQDNHRKPILWLCLGFLLMILLSGCKTHGLNTLTVENEPEPAETVDYMGTPPATEAWEGETISEIQGAGHVSPFENQKVHNVHGIVTAVRADGFYLQSAWPDHDPATSEGIFIFKGLIPSVKPGDEVLVDGLVEEWVPGGFGTGNLTITQIRFPYVTVLSSGNALPSPVIIGEGGRMPPTEIIDSNSEGFVSTKGVFNPEIDGIDFYESLEGMLLQVNDAVVVGPTNPFNEIVILPDMGRWSGVRTPRGGIVVRDIDFNPERIILADGMRQLPLLQTGDFAAGPIIGVISYSYGNYKLQPLGEVRFNSGGLQPDAPLPSAEPGHLRVASYNVENLSARQTGRITELADQIVKQMASPDIIGLQEIMDNDGSTGTMAISADETYQGIIDAIQQLGGPPYGFVDIDPIPDRDGGIPFGNIRVGFLYRLDSGLSLVEAPHGDAKSDVEILEIGGKPALSLNPGRIDPTHFAFTDSRKSLVVTFLYQGEPLFLINNHFNSKSADAPLFGELQPPVLASEFWRNQQAQIVHDFTAALLSVDPDSRMIVLGDLNDFHFSTPVQILKGEILHNLIETLPVEERYTYVYEGNSQVLDHILVSGSLFQKAVSVDILHINAEFDYLSRFSDHDAVIATIAFD